mmetsp:Transcript_61690/g.110675  ORF Transcript_61690/g.110675 Transcript_61690/m.110675 type:complete len:215 (-) Transcript_61690:154-798(-)
MSSSRLATAHLEAHAPSAPNVHHPSWSGVSSTTSSIGRSMSDSSNCLQMPSSTDTVTFLKRIPTLCFSSPSTVRRDWSKDTGCRSSSTQSPDCALHRAAFPWMAPSRNHVTNHCLFIAAPRDVASAKPFHRVFGGRAAGCLEPKTTKPCNNTLERETVTGCTGKNSLKRNTCTKSSTNKLIAHGNWCFAKLGGPLFGKRPRTIQWWAGHIVKRS